MGGESVWNQTWRYRGSPLEQELCHRVPSSRGPRPLPWMGWEGTERWQQELPPRTFLPEETAEPETGAEKGLHFPPDRLEQG